MLKYTKVVFGLIAISLSSCSTLQSKEKKLDFQEITESAETLYNNGIIAMQKSKYDDASENLDNIFLMYPNHHFSQKSQLLSAYSSYLNHEYEDTIEKLNLFLQLHSDSQYSDYAYYLRAISEYKQISEPKLEQSKSLDAKDEFLELIVKFPNSKYARDAALKIDKLNNYIAAHEMYIGRHALQNQYFISAMSRFNRVIESYPHSIYIYEALYRMIEITSYLNMQDECDKYFNILQIISSNISDKQWYNKATKILNKI